ncbi:serine/threonine-protein kinase [Limnoglobus roseus]|uniref:serine/threonine-protein kinase n=1 Tax=Limnoglobus roseus TaxID=2598579 RepID=UPI0036F37F88
MQTAHEQANRVFAAYAHSLPGSVLDGKYQIYEQLGSGGFGVVLRGHHLMLDYPVAIKVFRPVPGNDSALELQRFFLEGATTARLTHPNAVRVHDSGVSVEGVAFLVMELLRGWSLANELTADGPLPLHRAVTVARRVAEVLAAAHEAGILHRDIKPDNVFLHHEGDEEVVKVVDFGIAKFFGEQHSAETSRLTKTGRYVGTPAFVAPERVTGDVTDGRSDVFSLGAVLYEILTGVSPWTEEQLRDIASGASRHLRPRPLRKFRPEVPLELEELVNKTLAWKLADRPTAVELAGTLMGIACQLPVEPLKVKVRLTDQALLPNVKGSYAGRPKDDDTGDFWLSGIQ